MLHTQQQQQTIFTEFRNKSLCEKNLFEPVILCVRDQGLTPQVTWVTDRLQTPIYNNKL